MPRDKDIKLWELFHEYTKLRPSIVHKQLPSEKEIVEIMRKQKRFFPITNKIKLEVPSQKIKVSLEKVIFKRRSVRKFSDKPLTFQQLSKLLKLVYGVSSYIYLSDGKPYGLRTVPTAGALHTCELYIICFNVKNIPRGIYHFNPDEELLELLKKSENILNEFEKCLSQPSLFSGYSLAIVITGLFSKTFYKYGERGYRYVFLDGGHIGENIYLVTTAMGLGTVGICGFYDDLLSKFLMIDSYEEILLYVFLVGRMI